MISYIEQKGQWFDNFYKLSLEEKYETYINLLEQDIPDEELIEDDFGSVAVDLKSDLIRNNQYEKAIHLIEKTKESTDKFYQKEHPYLGNFAVEYYLYIKDSEKVHDHLQPFIANPDHGYDMFTPLFDKLIFYQMGQLALTLAEKMYKIIKESDNLIGGAEIELVDMIFYNAWQEHYQSLEQNTGISSTKQIKDTFTKYDYNDDFFEKEFPAIAQTLTKIASDDEEPNITANKWVEAVQANSTEAIRNLYWAFAVYMLKQRGIHFSISASIWFPYCKMLSKGDSLTDFNFTYKDLDELIGEYFGFFSNEEEKGFVVTWGIPYIYDFLYGQELIEKNTHDKALKHVQAIKKNLLKLYTDEAWRFDFVHVWNKPLSIGDESWREEIDHFHQSFLNREMKKTAASSTTSKNNHQLSLFDNLLNEGKNNQSKKSKPSKATKSNKRKQVKKQRKKNRKK